MAGRLRLAKLIAVLGVVLCDIADPSSSLRCDTVCRMPSATMIPTLSSESSPCKTAALHFEPSIGS